MTRERELVERVRKATESFETIFSKKVRKFGGAAAAAILHDALREEGIPTSGRDVFIQGVPAELDLVIPYENEKPDMGLLYEPLYDAFCRPRGLRYLERGWRR